MHTGNGTNFKMISCSSLSGLPALGFTLISPVNCEPSVNDTSTVRLFSF